jgi:hypothetical protein
MHTGTLIADLMATVERVELRGVPGAEQRRFDEWELQRIYGLRTPVVQNDQVYMGAA